MVLAIRERNRLIAAFAKLAVNSDTGTSHALLYFFLIGSGSKKAKENSGRYCNIDDIFKPGIATFSPLSYYYTYKDVLIPDEEKQLIDRIRKDSAEFGTVFDLYYTIIFGYLFRRLGDYDLACDIASETFLKAFLSIGSFQWKGVPVLFWLYRIGNNEILQYYRKKKYLPQSLDSIVEANRWDMIDQKYGNEEKIQLETEMQKHEDFLAIQKKMKLLPVEYQEILSLRYFEQKTIKEIAMIKDKKEGTIKSLLSRGIAKLKNLL